MVCLWSAFRPAESVALHEDQFWIDLGQTRFAKAKGLTLCVGAVYPARFSS
jgi:hypothetical protein